jgi:hypothetical protein
MAAPTSDEFGSEEQVDYLNFALPWHYSLHLQPILLMRLRTNKLINGSLQILEPYAYLRSAAHYAILARYAQVSALAGRLVNS